MSANTSTKTIYAISYKGGAPFDAGDSYTLRLQYVENAVMSGLDRDDYMVIKRVETVTVGDWEEA